MKLKKYLSSQNIQVTEFAKYMRTTPPYVSRIMSGSSICSPKRAVLIEKLTGEKVMRWDLRKDWKEIWPELAQREDAPGRKLSDA